MADGNVDENWAKQHHSLWLEEEKAKGKVEGPAGRMQPAE
jgi:formate dehydrogenase subunit gamma